ncbi:hypothetical protein C482_00050, partial [Natrialba chahannaoensis JCM 10990]
LTDTADAVSLLSSIPQRQLTSINNLLQKSALQKSVLNTLPTSVHFNQNWKSIVTRYIKRQKRILNPTILQKNLVMKSITPHSLI